MAREHQLGRYIHKMIMVRGVGHSGSRQQGAQISEGETGWPKGAHEVFHLLRTPELREDENHSFGRRRHGGVLSLFCPV